MCGIVGGYGVDAGLVERAIAALRHRGPDAEGITTDGPITLGHTRLAIRDLDHRSDQPFRYGAVTLVYNGELWNDAAVRRDLDAIGYTFATTGDTEVVAAALDAWGVDALPRLNGMFAMAWTTGDGTLYLARDRYGEISLHYFNGYPFAFASELKGLMTLGCHRQGFRWVEPGTVITVTDSGLSVTRWYETPTAPASVDRPAASRHLATLIERGARERAVSDVSVCTLLSGGIDSAAVALYLAEYVPNLTAYVAVMNPASPDVRAARIMAAELSIPLIEVSVTPPSSSDLARCVEVVEMPHKAQVEIAWACLALAKRIGADGHKVVFSGEGSDELWASYGFAYHALSAGADWHKYRRDLFVGQHRKNFARCNKVFMAHGIECRLPFLHPELVEYALSLPQLVVQDGKSRPKAVLQDAFRDLLPRVIATRAKLAFQDGLGLKAAAAAASANPTRFYRAEYERQYGGVA